MYAEATYDYTNFDNEDPAIIPLAQSKDVQSSCNGLVPMTIHSETDTQYRIWYIVVSFEPQTAINWVYVGEVQFFDTPPPNPPPNQH